jgi:hypothetical protein
MPQLIYSPGSRSYARLESLSDMPGKAKGIPDEFFIFVNQASFWTRHNFALTGKFVSAAFGAANPDQIPTGTMVAYGPAENAPRGTEALREAYESGTLGYLMFDINPNYFGFPTPFCASVSNDYRVEYDAEQTRLRSNPILPSRLSAIYAFGDYESCKQVSAKYPRWELAEVERFRLLPHPSNRVARVNMEIVSLARVAYRSASWTAEQIYGFWRRYWSGGGSISIELPMGGTRERLDSGEIWEYLIEGALERIT